MQQEGNNERLILVDENDTPIGEMDKEACHDGHGHRHRAFSIWVMDANQRILVQQRAGKKRLWPFFWSNACCSHPRVGETTERAAHRRLMEELEMEAESLTWCYSFNYQCQFTNAGSENEHCHVFIARSTNNPLRNPDEVAAFRWLTATQLDREIEKDPDQWSPWAKMEWEQLRERILAEKDATLSGTLSGR